MKMIIAAAAVAALGLATQPAMAQGKKTGFVTQTTTVASQNQGGRGERNDCGCERGGRGGTTVTTITETGPRGVLKNNNTDNPNYSVKVETVQRPGRER